MMQPERSSHDEDPIPGSPEASGFPWEAVMWALAVAAFALAMWLSYRGVRAPGSGDLQTPGVLLLDAALAMAIALIFAARQGALARPVGSWWCVVYGLWAAAVFRLWPLRINDVLSNRNIGSLDVPYILVGAGIYGFIAFLLALPYARRVLSPQGRLSPDSNERIWELAVATVVAFFLVAVVVRFQAGM
ncbi:MAG: hypothetical protein JSV65_06450 [Armatimonadota bacterium]|nr:MAG: hypothetical protein JSV65_06450 [Armatimonadota bacterium]